MSSRGQMGGLQKHGEGPSVPVGLRERGLAAARESRDARMRTDFIV